MLEAIKKYPAISAIVAVIVIALFLGLLYGVQSWAYHRGQARYEAESKAWQIERAKLIADAEAKEKRIAELEPQVVAYKAAAEAGKRLDEEKAKQIEDLGKKEAEDEANANIPTDCRVRADRICTLFRASDKRFDCKPLFDQCSEGR